jgi:hypothetical protein
LRDVEGFNHNQACDELGIDPDGLPGSTAAPVLPLFMTKDEPPNSRWMDAAEHFVWRAERYMWTHYTAQIDVLHNRGLTDDTIRAARLGYCPGWYSDDLQNWGLTSIQTSDQTEIKIPGGLVIPWFVDNKIWKISVRRPEQGYFQVLGSSDALYNIDTLKPGSPVVLVESEIDALSVMQEASHVCACVATGGANKCFSARWIARLIQASYVLVSFDQDETREYSVQEWFRQDEAGERGADRWLDVLPNAMRWVPWAKDVNQMLQDGIYISPWVVLGLSLLTHPPQQTQPQLPLQPQIEPVETPPALSIPPIQKLRLTWQNVNERGLAAVCSCRTPAVYWRGNEAFCEKCRPPKSWYENL